MPEQSAELLVAGSVALDTRDGPFGKVDETLGGSAVYFALAASLIVPVKVMAPVGVDGAKRVAQAFSGRTIDVDMLQILEAPTYRWRAHQEHGRNVDLGSTDNIYDAWEPTLPHGFAGWAFVGSMRPDRQAQVMRMLGGAQMLAADAMLSYLEQRPPEAKDVLSRSSWYFCNQDEFTALGGRDADASVGQHVAAQCASADGWDRLQASRILSIPSSSLIEQDGRIHRPGGKAQRSFRALHARRLSARNICRSLRSDGHNHPQWD